MEEVQAAALEESKPLEESKVETKEEEPVYDFFEEYANHPLYKEEEL